MKQAVIDAHIHLEMYSDQEQKKLLKDMKSGSIQALIAVSNHLKSAYDTLDLARENERIKPAVGFHPEQLLPSEEEIEELLSLSERFKLFITAIGEVGLPYYLKKEDPQLAMEPYVTLLKRFIHQAAKLNKPVILHAIYDQADLVCDLLEQESIAKAHFHWFKGKQSTMKRMINNRYFISITPDCLYEREIQNIIDFYPIELMMVETDGPWPFNGPFTDQLTHPAMIHSSINQISKIKQLPLERTYSILFNNTCRFYDLAPPSY
ncbi:TatD family hydrolase [Halobacillus rhizosphaerae]|uniref:TatD family hydrolase n=1 Tax=Halobacillus rhizosphaerae TaxID=3064889 RepID=UPI00398BB325